LLGAVLCRGKSEIETFDVLIAPQPGLSVPRGAVARADLTAAIFLEGGHGIYALTWSLVGENFHTTLESETLNWPDGEVVHALYTHVVMRVEFPQEGIYRLVFLCDGFPLADLGFLVEFSGH